MTTTVLSFQSILPINVEISCILPFHVRSWKAEKICSFLTKSLFQDSLLSQFPSFWWLCRMSLPQNLFGVFLIIGGMLDLGLKTAVLGCQSQHNCRTQNISSLFILTWLSGRGSACQFSPLFNCVPAPTFQLYFKRKKWWFYLCESPTWVQGPASATFPGTWARCWGKSGAARTQTCTHNGRAA